MEAAQIITDIWSQDRDVGFTLASLSWLADGVNEDELHAFRFLYKISETEIDLANTVAAFPWLADDVTEDEWEAIWALSRIALEDPKLARTATKLPWFAERVTSIERSALAALGNIASVDPDLARTAIDLPWVIDGMTDEEGRALQGLAYIASNDLKLASRVLTLPWVENQWDRRLIQYLLISLESITARGTDALSQLSAQSWFADGPSEAEAALVITLAQIDDATLYQALLEAHHSQSRTVSLPLAGEVKIWVFQNTPLPPNEDLLTSIEETARMSEELLGAPFPTTDIILLVVDLGDTFYRVYPQHYGSHMVLTRESSSAKVFYVPHETAHYYFFTGPRWLTEGAAELIETYFNHRTGVTELAFSRAGALTDAQNCVHGYGMENIRHLYHVLQRAWEPNLPELCLYQMGENFLHHAILTVGENAIMSALGELYVSLPGRGRQAAEELIYEVFLKHVPVERQENFTALYRELHGGAAAFEDSDSSDDHGDQASAATDVRVQESIDGELDYMWDFDYFRFSAQKDQKYSITVNHDTLRANSVGLYGPDGMIGENKSWISREVLSGGPRIVWVAPTSEEYYVAVHNFGGETGKYTLTITPVENSPLDDHRDTEALANDVSFGTIVEGTINDDLDIDYFAMREEAGNRYRLSIEGKTLREFSFRVALSDGGFWTFTTTGRDFSWTARSSGKVTIAVQGHEGSIGTYALTVTPVDD